MAERPLSAVAVDGSADERSVSSEAADGSRRKRRRTNEFSTCPGEGGTGSKSTSSLCVFCQQLPALGGPWCPTCSSHLLGRASQCSVKFRNAISGETIELPVSQSVVHGGMPVSEAKKLTWSNDGPVDFLLTENSVQTLGLSSHWSINEPLSDFLPLGFGRSFSTEFHYVNVVYRTLDPT